MSYGLAVEAEGRSEEAFQLFQRAVELSSNPFTQANLGLAYLRLGEAKTGMFHLRKAVEIDPGLPEAHLSLAHGLEQQGQIEEAEKSLLTSLRLRPDYLLGHRRQAEFHERQGDWLEALSA